MPTFREVAFSLFGAWRLALWDARGLGYFQPGSLGAMRSFFAAVLVLPAVARLTMMRLGDDGVTTPLGWVLLVEAIAYIINWTAYALLMDEMSRFLDRSDRYPLFLTAYNWSSVLQMMIYLPAVALSESGALPNDVGDFVVFAVTIMVLSYQWFVTQVTLELPGLTAAGLVILDLVLSVFISGAADGML